MNVIIEQINMTGQRFVEHAFAVLMQSSLLIAILLLADLLLRRKVRAVFRYWIWMLVLLKLVLPTWLSTPFSLGHLLGGELAYVDISRTTIETETMETTPVFVSPIIDPSRIEASRAMLAATVAPDIPDVEPAEAAPAERASKPLTPLSWQGILFLLWLAIVAAMGLLLLQRAVFVRRLIRQACAANDMMNEALEYCCQCMGIRRNVSLKISVNATSPAVCGLFRPVILLPRNLGPTLGSSHLRTVLMHELAHIKRGDLWVNTVQTVLQIVYFYNPLLWLANAIIRGVREQAVDETVLVAMGPKAQQYPETLLNVARLAWQRPALSLRLIGVIESKSQLKERISKMLERPIPKSAKLGIAGMLIVFTLGVFLLPMAKANESAAEESAVSEESKAQTEAELNMLKEQIAQLKQQLERLQQQVKQKQSQIAEVQAPAKAKDLEKKKTDVDKANKVVSVSTPKPPAPPIPPAPPEIKLPPIPQLPPMPQLPPEIKPEEISKSMPKIETPKEAIQQLNTMLAEKASLEQEINRLREQLEKKKQTGSLSDPEAKELTKKIETMERKCELLSNRSDELVERIENWSEQVDERMSDWIERIQERIRRQHEEKYEKEIEQYQGQMEHFEHQMERFEEQMEQWSEQFEHQMEQWAEQFNSEMESSFEKLEDELDVLDDMTDDITGDSKDDNRVTFRKEPDVLEIPLAAGKQVVVKNHVGSIKISVGKTGQCKCKYTIKAKAQTMEQAKQKAEPVKIEVDENDKTLTLTITKPDGKKWNNINVDLDIQVPQNTDIIVTNDVGNIKIIDMNGKIEGTTDVGDIIANNVQGDIKLRTDVGKIYCDVQDDISAEVIASTDVGSIKTELPLEVTKSNFTGGKASGVLGKGDNKVELRTNVGSITIR